jgi:hypothetical protein
LISDQHLVASDGLHDAERLVAGLAQHGGAGPLGGHGGAGSSLGLEGADVQGGGVLALAVGLPGVLWAEAGNSSSSSRSAPLYNQPWQHVMHCHGCRANSNDLQVANLAVTGDGTLLYACHRDRCIAHVSIGHMRSNLHDPQSAGRDHCAASSQGYSRRSWSSARWCSSRQPQPRTCLHVQNRAWICQG